jgi:predicted DNA-binding antitoxin AbrB/MazE fold protein
MVRSTGGFDFRPWWAENRYVNLGCLLAFPIKNGLLFVPSFHLRSRLPAMTKTFSAIFENGVFRPVEPVDFPEHCQVRIAVRSVEPANVVARDNEAEAAVPVPQRVRLVGKLAGFSAGTRTFDLVLDDGREVAGALVGGEVSGIARLIDQRVFVLGVAIYRPSGDLTRIDADEVGVASDESDFFSTIPRPTAERFDLDEVLSEQCHKRGVSAIIGQWPGNETDDEVAAALKELS